MKNNPYADELTKLLHWVEKLSEKQFYKYQEVILRIAQLLSSKEFHDYIASLRDNLGIPPHLYSVDAKSVDTSEEWFNYTKSHPDAPLTPDNKLIADICTHFKLEPIKYGEFFFSYLYDGEVIPSEPILPAYKGLVFNADEFRYKTTLEYDSLGASRPQNAYIRFYKDTSINKLITFIRKNKAKIKELQTYLKPYSHTQVRDAYNAKRDTLIYLYRLLGMSAQGISKTLLDRYNMNDYPYINRLIGRVKGSMKLSPKKKVT